MVRPLTPRQKATMFAVLPPPAPFEVAGYLITVTLGPRMWGDTLEVEVSVTYQGRAVPISNPLRFVNPPVAGGDLSELLKEIIAGTVLSVAGRPDS
ncbi:MAG: hypothetical protein ACE5Q6_16870 [Dehalococcoidia bacterium]